MKYDKNIKTIDEYIKAQPKKFRATLQTIRKTIKKAVPKAEEAIRYGMPTFRLKNKNMVHFASHKAHYAFYPTPTPILKFSKELEAYDTSKGTIRFPMDTEIPHNLITQIVKFRVSEINTQA